MLLVLLIVLAVLAQSAASAETGASSVRGLRPDFMNSTAEFSPVEKQIIDADRAIFLELIHLARFNITFHQACNKQWVWRSWLYPIAQEAGTACSFANTITDLDQRARGLHNLDLISRSAQKRGLSSAIVGNTISGTSSAAELTQNLLVVHLAAQQGFSPKQSVVFVKASLTRIDALLLQRRKLTDALDAGPTFNALKLEEHLIKQIRAQLLLEFKRWSADSRAQMWYENTFYTIDSAQNFTNVGSGILSFQGYTDRTYKGSAAITVLVANSLAATNPLIRTYVGWCMRKHERRRLAKELPDSHPRDTKEILAQADALNAVLSAGQPTAFDSHLIKEIAFLAENTEQAETVVSKEQAQMERLRQVAAQQAISGPIIGMFSVARSLLATVAYYGYDSRPAVANRLLFAGRISQATGQTYSLITTPTTRIRQSIYTRKLARKGELPEQILRKRLHRLDQLESEINSEQKTPVSNANAVPR